MPDNEKLSLPLSIAQQVDIGRLLYELGLIDEHLNQVAIKEPGKQVVVKSSAKLSDLVELNNLDLTNKEQRLKLIDWLKGLQKSAKVINVSFGAEASERFVQAIVKWFRTEVDPSCLLIVGLEPTIGAGSVVRTSNKIFNFSLKNRLRVNRGLLLDEIKKLDTGQST
jgi:F0F1-type ATP synthase delta subunit